MTDLLRKNWGRALGEVSASMIGALGAIFLVALALSGQNNGLRVAETFSGYFSRRADWLVDSLGVRCCIYSTSQTQADASTTWRCSVYFSWGADGHNGFFLLA